MMCEVEDCKTRASFGFDKPVRCKKHTLEGMINLTTKSRKCKGENCAVQACFGIEFKKPIYCSNHSTAGMIDVVSKRCIVDECKRRPYYGLQYKKQTHCPDHREIEHMNVVSKRCLVDDCMNVGYPIQDMLCNKHNKQKQNNYVWDSKTSLEESIEFEGYVLIFKPKHAKRVVTVDCNNALELIKKAKSISDKLDYPMMFMFVAGRTPCLSRFFSHEFISNPHELLKLPENWREEI